jgi:hypothetical protein
MSLFSKVELTVESIVKDIQVKVAQLHIVAEAKGLEAKAHDEVVAVRQELSKVATEVAAKAKSIAAKFEALIS